MQKSGTGGGPVWREYCLWLNYVYSDDARSLIPGPAPDWAYCSCLPTNHLLSTSSQLWQEGFPGAALISVCLSFSISHPCVGESSLGQGWTGEMLNGRAHGCGTISSVRCSRRLSVSGHTAACLTPATVMNQSALPLQLHLPNMAPHLCRWDHSYCWHLHTQSYRYDLRNFSWVFQDKLSQE